MQSHRKTTTVGHVAHIVFVKDVRNWVPCQPKKTKRKTPELHSATKIKLKARDEKSVSKMIGFVN